MRYKRTQITQGRAGADRTARLMLDANPFACCVWDDCLRLIDCNEATVKLFLLNTKHEFCHSFFALSAPIQQDGQFAGQLLRHYLEEAMEKGEITFRWENQNLLEEPIPTEITVKKTPYHDSFRLFGYLRDLRPVIAAEALMNEAIDRNQLMIDATPVSFLFWDDSFQLVDCNQAALTLFKHPNKLSMLANFKGTEPMLGGESFLSHLQRTLSEGKAFLEWSFTDEDGGELPVEATLIRVEYRESFRIAGYLRDLREHKLMMREITRAKEIAEEGARVKSEFLANMSHEIRTPMNGIIGMTNLVLKMPLASEQRDYVQKIDQSAKNLLRIINDILDFSKIEAGKLEMEKVPFRVEDVFKAIQTLVDPAVTKKGIQFLYEIPESLDCHLSGDALRLQQVLVNIINNAVKFTSEGSVKASVIITEQIGKDYHLKFSVTDTGIGMTEQQIKRIFEPFGQADSSTSRKYGGTGLGLTICKTLVQMMGGEIWCESEPGVGTSFYFSAIFSLADERDIPLDASAGAIEIPDEYKDARILLAEDNEINQIIMVELMAAEGFTLDVANNGQQAVDMVFTKPYEIVFMDIQMPVMDGFAATERIRQNPAYASLPIIAMTANAMSGDREKSIAVGMNDHVTKPIEPAHLFETTLKWLRRD